MDLVFKCACLDKCPASSGQRGTYNSYDREQIQRQLRAGLRQTCVGGGARFASADRVQLQYQDGQLQQQPLQYLDSRKPESAARYGLYKWASIYEEEADCQQECHVLSGHRSSQNNNNNNYIDTQMGNIKSSPETSEESSASSASSRATAGADRPAPTNQPALSSFTLEGIAELIRESKINKSSVIVLVGAGMSTAAGVPDFRSPETGIYANLAKFQLAQPEDVFKIDYFKNNPAPFYELSRSLLPRRLYPTMAHYFVRLLNEKGLLLRCFSQNVDCLESLSGLPKDKLCLAHGSFETGHCLRCNADYSLAWMRQIVEQGGIPHCTRTPDCKGLVKPDVKFFGERLDGRFFRLVKQDFGQCELLIIIGSSLSVMPFAQLVQKVPARCPRLLINKTKSGHTIPAIFRLFRPKSGLMYDRKGNVRDVAYLGDCDEACLKLAELLGWREELVQLAERRRRELDQGEPA